MTSIIFQALLSVVAGAALFFMWRRVASSNRWVGWLVTAGVLIRAVGGQVVFWISYLHLPFARSLQLGNGFWLFGLDAMTYFQQAMGVAASGPKGILFASPGFGSVFYVQTLATVILLFGPVEMVGVLLNIGAYLGCCLIALSFGDPARHRAVVFTIAALSLAPATVMWSLQPMKDTWFMFLVAAFFGAARLWQQAWIVPGAWERKIAWTLALAATLYGISGIRWYFGLIAAVACLPFFVLTILRTSPRAVSLAGAAIVAPILFASVLLGSGPSMSVVFTFVARDEPPIVAIPRAFLTYLHYSRAGFERTGGATMIGAGHAISAVDAQLGNREEHVQPTRFDETTLPKRAKRHPGQVDQKPAQASNPASSAAALASSKLCDAETGITRPALADGNAAPPPTTASTTASTPSASSTMRDSATSVDTKPSDTPPATGEGEAAATSKVESPIASPPPALTSANTPVASTSTDRDAATSKPSDQRKAAVNREAAPKRMLKPASGIAAMRPPANNKPPAAVCVPGADAKTAHGITPPPAAGSTGTGVNPAEGPAAGTVAIPSSHTARLLAGTAAMILPRAIAQRLGLLDVRGGRGLWLFVEFDTIVFDVVCFFCVAAIVGAGRRGGLRAPVFWLILMVTVVVGGLLAYTVSNFGTLFRHREMVLLGLLLLPLAALPQGDAPALVAEDAHDAAGDVPNSVQSA